MQNETWAIIPAAGQGTRLAAASGGTAKQFLRWRGAPLWWHSAKTLAASPCVHGLVLVFPPDALEEATQALASLDREHSLGVPWKACPGGPRRQDSVRLGLQALPTSCSLVLVHDAARPFLPPDLPCRLVSALRSPDISGSIAEVTAGVVPGLPLADTVKEADETGVVLRTLERAALRAVQTPQAFFAVALREAHARALAEGWEATDDASLLERCGRRVLLVPGDPANVKITMPEDLALLNETPALSPCCGYGYDVHRYGGDRPLVLGGVPIPGGFSVQAHSDGDVLLHALMDAILGCLGAGDIGRHFPDNDPRWESISSAVLLDHVLVLAADAGLRLTHADLTVVAQKPRIAPHAEGIRRNVARLLGLGESHVNVKATTEEGLGFTGELQGLKAVALVSALRPE